MPAVTVIAIDASPQAEAAFQWYLDHIHTEGTSIVILHCVDLTTLAEQASDDFSSSEDSTTGRLWDQQKSKIKALEDKYRWKLNENGIAGKIITDSGKAGEVIIRVAKQEKATLLAIGSRGLSKFKRTIQGSVSDYVLHHAHCPVIICRQMEGSPQRTLSCAPSAGGMPLEGSQKRTNLDK